MELFYYSVINYRCSCRDSKNELSPIGKRYKEYYELLVSTPDKNGAEILNDMEIYRTCCRMRFLSLPTIPMINRVNKKIQMNSNTIPIKKIFPKYNIPEFPN